MEFGAGAFYGIYGVDSLSGVVRLIVIILAMGCLVHVAARMVLGKSTLPKAMAASVLAFLAFYLVLNLVVVHALGVVLGAAAFAGVIAFVYKAKQWSKGASVGAVACVLFYLSGIVLHWVVASVR